MNMMDLKAPVEGHDGIFVIRRGENCRDDRLITVLVGAGVLRRVAAPTGSR